MTEEEKLQLINCWLIRRGKKNRVSKVMKPCLISLLSGLLFKQFVKR